MEVKKTNNEEHLKTKPRCPELWLSLGLSEKKNQKKNQILPKKTNHTKTKQNIFSWKCHILCDNKVIESPLK